jgi:ketosteroid isomerase-like protein
MPSPNLDLVRSIWAAWERGDFSSVEWAHPEIEAVFAEGLAPGGVKGLPAMAARWRDFLGVWQEFRVEVEEYRELDDERVLVLGRSKGRGRTSGLKIEQMRSEAAALFHVSDGKVTKLVLYGDRDRALTDLGLAPEGGSP